jgi:hypothetical protein
MAEFGKTRRKPKTKRARNEIVLDFRNPSRDLQVQRQLSRSSFDRFRGGNVDPFTPYPIELTDASRELLVNGEFCSNSNSGFREAYSHQYSVRTVST